MSKLEDQFKKMELEKKATEAVEITRARMVLTKDPRRVFFTGLALKLQCELSWEVPTMATDGQRILINPEFTMSLNQQQLDAVLNMHEPLHCGLGHHTRRGQREPIRWNLAADLAINQMVEECGGVLPPTALLPGKEPFKKLPKGLSTEEYYEMIPLQQGGYTNGDDPGGCGGVMDSPKTGEPAALAEEQARWQVNLAQAAHMAQKRGTLPAGIARLVESMLKPKVNWEDQLAVFLNKVARNDFNWSTPNRRYFQQGTHLPGLRSQEIGTVVFAMDWSGSIGQDAANRFAAEFQAAIAAYECDVIVLHHDAAVGHVQRWHSSDGPLRLEPVGGGGTDHRPVFDWVKNNQVEPAVMVCLTDLQTCFPQRSPDYPVLWCSICPGSAPFGDVIVID